MLGAIAASSRRVVEIGPVNITYTPISQSLGGGTTYLTTIGVFSHDGSNYYTTPPIAAGNFTYQYTASSAYDITTLTEENAFDRTAVADNPFGIDVNNDTTKMLLTAQPGGNHYIFQYDFATQFDASTLSLIDSASLIDDLVDITVNSDGSKLWGILNKGGNNWMVEYDFGTNYDVTTLSPNINSASLDSGSNFFTFNSAGNTLWVSEQANNFIYQYSLSSAFDLTTLLYVTGTDLSGDITDTIRSIDLNTAEDKMFVLEYKIAGGIEGMVRELTLG